MTKTLLALVLIAVTSIGWQQKSVAINQGFFRSEEFLQMPEAQKEGFAAGLVDGIYLAPILGAPEENIERLHNCIAGMSTTQVAAIIEKFLKEHPEKWHQRLNVEAYNAVDAACGSN
jgi:hypothetical protein